MIDIMRYFCAETFICAVSTVKSKKRKKKNDPVLSLPPS